MLVPRVCGRVDGRAMPFLRTSWHGRVDLADTNQTVLSSPSVVFWTCLFSDVADKPQRPESTNEGAFASVGKYN